MNFRNLIFVEVFTLSRNNEEPILNKSDRSLAQFVYNVAFDEVNREYVDVSDDDDDSLRSFQEELKEVINELKYVCELFKTSKEALRFFLEKFEKWSALRKRNIKRLKEIAEEIESNRKNSNISRVVGYSTGVVGSIVGCLSLLTPLAAITVPLVVTGGVTTALGTGVVFGTNHVEPILLKAKLKEAKTCTQQENNCSSSWFSHSEKLKKAIESFLSYSLLQEISQILRDFQAVNAGKLREDVFANRFKEALKLCIGKMLKSSTIVRLFGVAIAPVVMTFFIVVCLLKHQNKVILDHAMDTIRLGMNRRMGGPNYWGRGVICGEKPCSGNLLYSIKVACVVIEIVSKVIDAVQTSVELFTHPRVEDAVKLRDSAELLEDEFLFVESVHDALQNRISI